jgi:phosphatidylserine decarboxylase
MSTLVGKVAEIRFPSSALLSFLKYFVKKHKIDMSDYSKPLSEFRSFSEFFVRHFEPGARPIGEGFVSPVDGELKALNSLKAQQRFTIKGGDYDISELIGQEQKDFSPTCFMQFYLSPRNYHRFHAPCAMKVLSVEKIPGALFPVNSFGQRAIPNLFAKNLRVCIFADSEFGRLAYVPVGALNVGSIQLSSDIYEKTLEKGEEIGFFNLGSSVLILLEKNPIPCTLPPLNKPLEVKMGENLEKVLTNESFPRTL